MQTLRTQHRELLLEELSKRRSAVLENALSPQLVQSLRACAKSRTDFRAARIGRSLLTETKIRNDEIAWLDAHHLEAPEKDLFSVLEDLRLFLNQNLYLGLVDFEAHYARYEPGHFYAKHVDRFGRGTSGPSRAISVVSYLNEDWSDADGGELVLYLEPSLKVKPTGGTLVCFTSDDIEHEVLPAQRERLSIAAWFRQN